MNVLYGSTCFGVLLPLGKVRHLAIRTHLVRCHISLGDIELVWCTTESMVADVLTKIVSGAQDKRLAARFYNDVDLPLQLPNKTLKDGNEMVATSRQKKTKSDGFQINTGF